MTELLLNDEIMKPKIEYKKFSFFGFFTCLATFLLAFLFKDNLISLLNYLELKSTENVVEFHIILITLFILVSLPVLWGYLICILICSYVYSFVNGFILVVIYSAIGMSVSFFICRYMFYDCAHQRVKNIAYLKAISAIIESNEKGFQIILLSRLMPIPFGLANALFSVTDVQYRKYIVVSTLGLLPTHLIITYMGSTLKSMTDVLANESTARTASLVFIAQLFIAVGVMYYLLNTAKHELDKHLDNKNGVSSVNNDLDKTDLLNKCSSCNSQLNKSGELVECQKCDLIQITVQKT